MEWIIWSLFGIMVWAIIGGIHGLVQMARFFKKLEKFAHFDFSPNSDLRRLINRDFNTAILLGPIGVIVVGMDWLVRNWPESLVLGGESTKPTPAAAPTVANGRACSPEYRRRPASSTTSSPHASSDRNRDTTPMAIGVVLFFNIICARRVRAA